MTNASSASAVIRAATPSDVAAITRCVCAAYLRHIEQVGKQPWPMLQDYSNVIRTSQVLVAEREGRILGVLELKGGTPTNEALGTKGKREGRTQTPSNGM